MSSTFRRIITISSGFSSPNMGFRPGTTCKGSCVITKLPTYRRWSPDLESVTSPPGNKRMWAVTYRHHRFGEIEDSHERWVVLNSHKMSTPELRNVFCWVEGVKIMKVGPTWRPLWFVVLRVLWVLETTRHHWSPWKGALPLKIHGRTLVEETCMHVMFTDGRVLTLKSASRWYLRPSWCCGKFCDENELVNCENARSPQERVTKLF